MKKIETTGKMETIEHLGQIGVWIFNGHIQQCYVGWGMWSWAPTRGSPCNIV